MSVFKRAASLAVAGLCALGLAGFSGQGHATEPQRPVGITFIPAVATNVPTPAPVPLETPAVAVDEVVTAPTPEVRYASLTEAVATEGRTDETTDSLRCLAGAVYFESKGEPLSGQLAVANVIINRMNSGRFASDVCGVVTQRGQFSFVRGGRVPNIAPTAAYRTALAVARIALENKWDSAAPSALYFHGRREGAGARFVKVASIGNHVFYR